MTLDAEAVIFHRPIGHVIFQRRRPGVSSMETASIGGAAHLVNFCGSDTMPGLMAIKKKWVYGILDGRNMSFIEFSTIGLYRLQFWLKRYCKTRQKSCKTHWWKNIRGPFGCKWRQSCDALRPKTSNLDRFTVYTYAYIQQTICRPTSVPGEGLCTAIEYYNLPLAAVVGTSVPAAEHSTITSWTKAGRAAIGPGCLMIWRYK